MPNTERRFNCQTCEWETVELPLNSTPSQWDAEIDRIDRRRFERDGWADARWDRQRF